jgi:CubicO group peptidase (beta-lactamase class C family)
MGSVVLISYKGDVIYLDRRGWQNKKIKQEMELDTLFRMYSLSKPVTSAAVLQLAEQGLIDLEDPIDKYIPELSNLEVYNPLGNKPAEQQPTIGQLLCHSAGFSYGFFGVGPVDTLYNLNHPLMAKDSDGFIERLAVLPLVFEPGTDWRYGVSIDVLGVLIERVTGQSFGEYLETNIFEPLGMHDTGFVVLDEDIDRLGPMYTRFGVELESIAEMIVHQGTVDGTQVLSEASVQLMQTNQLAEGVRAVNGDGFGYGFQVQIEANNQSPVGEYTWDGIGSTHFWASPEHDVYVITLAQYMPFIPVMKYSLRPRIYKALDIEWQ